MAIQINVLGNISRISNMRFNAHFAEYPSFIKKNTTNWNHRYWSTNRILLPMEHFAFSLADRISNISKSKHYWMYDFLPSWDFARMIGVIIPVHGKWERIIDGIFMESPKSRGKNYWYGFLGQNIATTWKFTKMWVIRLLLLLWLLLSLLHNIRHLGIRAREWMQLHIDWNFVIYNVFK